jgi:hypothetical protein
MIGFSVGCYNPDMDPDGSCARDLVTLLGTVLSGGYTPTPQAPRPLG